MKKATSPATTSGNSVTLTANSLNEYTNYYYYVTVSDGKGNPVQGTVQGPIKTYCPGNTYTCEGPFTKSRECRHCLNYNGIATGKSGLHSFRITKTPQDYHRGQCGGGCFGCKVNSNGYWVDGECRRCNAHYGTWLCSIHINEDLAEIAAYYEKYCICSYCDGSKWETVDISCQHGEWETHQYCSHDYTQKHD